MKGIKIEIENEQPMYLYRPYDVIGAIAHALYYSANPNSVIYTALNTIAANQIKIENLNK